MRRGLFVLFVVLLVFVGGGRHFLNASVDPKSSQEVSVEIPAGLGARAIAQKLSDAGVLRSPAGFVLSVVLRSARDALKAGMYTFSPKESGWEIIGRLVRGDTVPPDASVTFPEGFTLKQIAARLAARGLVPEDEFLQTANASLFRSEFSFLEGVPEASSLEGYLFPDTYRFRQGATPEDIIRRMLRRFDEQWESARTACAQGTRQQAVGSRESVTTASCPLPTALVHVNVTMASIIEREVQTPEDRRLVAGVLWKRFDAGIGLDADATVRYAIGNWERPLTVDDLRIDSPYNTRRYRGLPPGPIGSPGLDSLQAALTPQSSEYLYYLSAPDGRTVFSVTLDEHNRAKAQYLRR